MGSQHSRSAVRHQSNAGSRNRTSDLQPRECSSPGPSISSDTDIPYIPYTVNRPIGGSPTLPSKSFTPSFRTSLPEVVRPKSDAGSAPGQSIIVIQEGLPPVDTLKTDSEVIKLQTISTFQPIMRDVLPTVQDPEILDKLNSKPVLKLCQRYQEHLRECSEVVSLEQNNIIRRIQEIDFAIVTQLNFLTQRQKMFVKYFEGFGKVQEIFNQLAYCESHLSEVIASMNSLNDLLPTEDQLEQFVMVTG